MGKELCFIEILKLLETLKTLIDTLLRTGSNCMKTIENCKIVKRHFGNRRSAQLRLGKIFVLALPLQQNHHKT
jgi:chaperonin GroEL (HSP60 family)